MDAVKLKWRRQFASSRDVRMAVLGAIAFLSFSFALFLWWFTGAWIILPFAGLEIVCVAFAFWWLELEAGDCDSVEVSDVGILVVRCRRQSSQQFHFKRGLLWVELNNDEQGAVHGVRLRQSGRSVDLVEFLPVTDQHRALREMRLAMNNCW